MIAAQCFHGQFAVGLPGTHGGARFRSPPGRWALPPPVPLGGTDESSVDPSRKRRLAGRLGTSTSGLFREAPALTWPLTVSRRNPFADAAEPTSGPRARPRRRQQRYLELALRASNPTKVIRSLRSGSALTPSSESTREHAHDDRTVASRSSHIF